MHQGLCSTCVVSILLTLGPSLEKRLVWCISRTPGTWHMLKANGRKGWNNSGFQGTEKQHVCEFFWILTFAPLLSSRVFFPPKAPNYTLEGWWSVNVATKWLVFTWEPCFLPFVPSLTSAIPQAGSYPVRRRAWAAGRAELKRGGTGGQEAAQVEGGEAWGPAGLVPRRQQRQRGDGAPAGPGAV